MRTNLVVGLALAFLSSLALAIEPERKADIFIWPLSAPTSSPLAKVSYNSTSATLHSYSPPKLRPNTDPDVVRIGFYHPGGAWSGIVTSASNFATEKSKKLQLLLNGDGELYHVGFRTEAHGTSGKTKGSQKDGLSVEVITTPKGPSPSLSKPVVVKEDGTEEGKEPEKSFLQKYWWAIAGFLVLQLVMSGGKGE